MFWTMTYWQTDIRQEHTWPAKHISDKRINRPTPQYTRRTYRMYHDAEGQPLSGLSLVT